MAIILNKADAIERMGDEELYKEIAHFFGQHIPENLQKLECALKASVAGEGGPEQLETAMRLSHSFKGNCATVGADEVRPKALELELLCRNNQAEQACQAFPAFKLAMLELSDALKDI